MKPNKILLGVGAGILGLVGVGIYNQHKGIQTKPVIAADFTNDGREDLLILGVIGNHVGLCFVDGKYVTKTPEGKYLRHAPGIPLNNLPQGKNLDDYNFSARDVDGDGKKDMVGYPKAWVQDFFLSTKAEEVWRGDGQGNFEFAKEFSTPRR